MSKTDDFPNTCAEYGDVAAAARMTSLSIEKLNKMRRLAPDESPPFARVGRRVIYKLRGPGSVEAWLDARLSSGEELA